MHWLMILSLRLIIIIAVFGIALFPQASAASSNAGTEKLYVSVDYALFRGDSSKAFVEIYYSFGVAQLHFSKEGNAFTCAVRLDVKVLEPQTDTVVYHRTWDVPYTIGDTSMLERSKSLVGVLGVWLRPAQYSLRVVGFDASDAKNRDSLQLPMNLRSFPQDSLTLSDVELCTSIRQISPDSNNIFYKNTLEVIPNPSVLYGAGLPIIFYYVEAYNLLHSAKTGDYAYTARVYDGTGAEVLKQGRTKRRVHDSSVEVGTINIGKLRSGTYSLKFSLNDSMAQQQVSSAKKFFVYNPGVAGSAVQAGSETRGDYLASEYSLMNEEDVVKEFEYSRYIALDDETRRFEKLTDVDGKRKFMFEFWKRRDPDPATKVNETKQEYLSRVEYATLNFRSGGKQGWRTDRGRVYIMYGPPDEFERHPNEIDSKPYEIWHYHNLQGGVEFVFIDKSSFSDYILVHSTHRNEIRDDNWQMQLGKQ